MNDSSATGRVSPLAIHSIAAHGLLLAAAVLLIGLAFPQPGWGWCAHVGLVPAVVLAIGATSTWRLLWTCYLMAWVWWLARISWLSGVTVGGYLGLAAVMAAYGPAVMGAVRWLYKKYPRLPVAVILPMAWVTMELIRGTVPAGGFAWFTLGHSQAPFAAGQAPGRLIQVADLFGEYGVSFLVAMTNGLLVDVILGVWAAYQRGPLQQPVGVRLSLLLWIIVLGGSWLYGQYRIQQTRGIIIRQAFAMAVVQTNVPQDNKIRPTPQQRHADWQRMLELTRQAAASPVAPSLVVWPETMVPIPLNTEVTARYLAAAHEDPTAAGALQYHHQIASTARQLNIDLIVGAAAYTWRQPGAGRYNAAYLYRNNGTQSSDRYDKIHRVPFGEYIPWVENMPWLKKAFIRHLSPHESDYTLQPGRDWTVFRVGSRASLLDTGQDQPRSLQQPATQVPREIRIATPICFEDSIAEVCRRMVYGDGGNKRVDLLVNLTNDGWYQGYQQRPQHMQIAVLRCVENRVPMARSVNTGVSGFIDSVGRVGPTVNVDGRSQHVDGSVSHAVTLDTRQSVWGQYGQTPVWGLAVMTGILLVVPVFRRSQPAISPLRMRGM